MKLASHREGRDGRLLVVSRDLTRAAPATGIAATLQEALDDSDRHAPALAALAERLEAGHCPEARAFDPAQCAAPLPRAYQWADGSAYLYHVELVRRARGAELPPSLLDDPLLYQGGSDGFLGPTEDLVAADEAYGIDFEGEVAVITDDVPAGASPDEALERIRLLCLVNDVSLRALVPDELAKGFGFFQAKPASALSPVAVTPDELGDGWRDGRVHGALVTHLNGELFGRPDAGTDMHFGFDRLVAHAARTRRLGAGSLIGSGTVSNRPPRGAGASVAEGGVGFSCLAELRTVETLRDGSPSTPFLRHGDRVRMEMAAADGGSLFGAIDQRVVVTGGRRS